MDAIVVELGASSLEPRPIADSERTAIVRVGGLGVGGLGVGGLGVGGLGVAMGGRMLML